MKSFKVLKFFLAAFLVASVVSLIFMALELGRLFGVEYTLNEDGESYTLSEYGVLNPRKTFEIPSTYQGKPVTKIGEVAFEYCCLLKSVTIPNSVTSIDTHAFSFCIRLTSVTIGDSVETIGEGAFWGCLSLASITVEMNNTAYQSIEGDLYSKDGKTMIQYAIGKTDASFTIPDSVETIGGYAFDGCTSLVSVTIPDSVETIGDYAFDGCDSLASVTIPDSVTTIGNFAFCGCTSLVSVTIPDSVTTIGWGAFWGCTSLTSVTIPDSVETIGNSAFLGCTSLANVTIGDSVATIGWGAFWDCTSLTSVYYKGDAAAWNAIDIGGDNSKLESATLYYYSETAPTESGNYWHYGASGEVEVWP